MKQRFGLVYNVSNCTTVKAQWGSLKKQVVAGVVDAVKHQTAPAYKPKSTVATERRLAACAVALSVAIVVV